MCNHGARALFPDQIFCEILIRLPAKSVCRFKCVSKRWLSLISDPAFIASYVSHSTPSWAILDRVVGVETGPKELTLRLREPPNVSSFFVSPHMVDEDLVDPSRREYPCAISGSRGFLLFAVSRKRDPYSEKERKPNSFSQRTRYDALVLCIPVTHQWIELPKPPDLLSHRASVGMATRAAGPGGVVPDFVVAEYQPIIGSDSATLMTFSSETGKWESKSANYMLGMHFWRPGGVVELDGHLFWVDVSCGLIVWDDPFSTEKDVLFRFIPFPQECWRRFDAPGLAKERCVGVGEGCIQYMELVDNGGFLRLWRLKDYEAGEWGLVYKASLMDIWVDESYLACGLPKVTPELLLIHPFEANVAFFVVGDKIFSVNLVKKKVFSCGVNPSLTGNLWVLPFLLPSWPTSFSPVLLASVAKDHGNEYFKDKNYNEAIEWYSRSIHHTPTAMGYANRAAAYLNISEYLHAENDCTEALKLDGEYMKVYARRAIARKELRKLKEAEQDAKLCLKLKPDQSDIQRLHAEIKSLLEKATIKGDHEDEVVPSM